VQGYLVADIYEKLDKKYPALANNGQPGAKKNIRLFGRFPAVRKAQEDRVGCNPCAAELAGHKSRQSKGKRNRKSNVAY